MRCGGYITLDSAIRRLFCKNWFLSSLLRVLAARRQAYYSAATETDGAKETFLPPSGAAPVSTCCMTCWAEFSPLWRTVVALCFPLSNKFFSYTLLLSPYGEATLRWSRIDLDYPGYKLLEVTATELLRLVPLMVDFKLPFLPTWFIKGLDTSSGRVMSLVPLFTDMSSNGDGLFLSF